MAKPLAKKDRHAPQILETFRNPSHVLSSQRQDNPSCYNGFVCVERYRITVELIEEPQEALKARLQDLLATATRKDAVREIHAEAKRLGITLEDSRAHKHKEPMMGEKQIWFLDQSQSFQAGFNDYRANDPYCEFRNAEWQRGWKWAQSNNVTQSA